MMFAGSILVLYKMFMLEAALIYLFIYKPASDVPSHQLEDRWNMTCTPFTSPQFFFPMSFVQSTVFFFMVATVGTLKIMPHEHIY